MRNTALINHFPPTLFSPNRSPIYGEAHFFPQPASRLVTSNPSLHGECPRAILVSDVDRPDELAAQGAGGVGIIVQVEQRCGTLWHSVLYQALGTGAAPLRLDGNWFAGFIDWD